MADEEGEEQDLEGELEEEEPLDTAEGEADGEETDPTRTITEDSPSVSEKSSVGGTLSYIFYHRYFRDIGNTAASPVSVLDKSCLKYFQPNGYGGFESEAYNGSNASRQALLICCLMRAFGLTVSFRFRPSPRNSEVNALEQRGYLIGKKIGQGSYATVHLADYVDSAGPKKMRLACKIFDKEKAPKDFLEKFFPRELEILTKIENPHIIQVHSILQRGPRVFIFMRYADNGDLLDFIKKNGVVPEQQAKIWFRQMASGLHYLHGKNIAHRDLKCENILLSRRFNVKLADFGFARFCVDSDNRRILSQTYCGSAAYAAPEVVNGTPYNPKLSDVWSLGIILFIMLNASMPFDDSNLRKLLKDQMTKNWVFRSRVRDTLSSSAKSLVRHLLEPDLTQRLTLDRVIQHEWLRMRKDRPSSLIGRLVHSAPHGQTASQSAHVSGEYENETVPGDFQNPESKKSEMMISVTDN